VENTVGEYIVRRTIRSEGVRLRSPTVSFEAEDVGDYIEDARDVLGAKLGF